MGSSGEVDIENQQTTVPRVATDHGGGWLTGLLNVIHSFCQFLIIKPSSADGESERKPMPLPKPSRLCSVIQTWRPLLVSILSGETRSTSHDPISAFQSWFFPATTQQHEGSVIFQVSDPCLIDFGPDRGRPLEASLVCSVSSFRSAKLWDLRRVVKLVFHRRCKHIEEDEFVEIGRARPPRGRLKFRILDSPLWMHRLIRGDMSQHSGWRRDRLHLICAAAIMATTEMEAAKVGAPNRGGLPSRGRDRFFHRTVTVIEGFRSLGAVAVDTDLRAEHKMARSRVAKGNRVAGGVSKSFRWPILCGWPKSNCSFWTQVWPDLKSLGPLGFRIWHPGEFWYFTNGLRFFMVSSLESRRIDSEHHITVFPFLLAQLFGARKNLKFLFFLSKLCLIPMFSFS